MRQRGGGYVNPTCEAFGPFYKSLLIKNLAARHNTGSNCVDDKLEMFLSLKNVLEEPLRNSEEITQEQAILNFSPTTAIPYLENQALNYVSGFILRRIKPLAKDCATCKQKMFTDNLNINHTYT